MLAEHSFVTTADAPDAFALAADAGAQLGFSLAGGDSLARAEWSRGPRKPGYYSLRKLPMRLRMDFDRGRVAVALAIDEPRQPDKLIALYGIAVLSSLEQAVCRGLTPEALAGALFAEKRVRRRDFWQQFCVWALASLFIFVPILAIIAAAVFGSHAR